MLFQRKDLSILNGTLKASLQQSRNQVSTRLAHLGPISLASLFIGGWILILTGFNCFLASRYGLRTTNVMHNWGGTSPFTVGYTWSVQIWLVIIGVGLSLVSHGLREAYMHFFDWWCSRQARTDAGLDYGRYLNTQPRAPVTYGVRGFTAFTSLRYLLATVAVAASIGYKFGISTIETAWTETLDPDAIKFSPHCWSQLIDTRGNISPWYMTAAETFVDEKAYVGIERGSRNTSRGHDELTWVEGLHYTSTKDETKPPENLALVGYKSIDGYLHDYGLGDIFSREVIVAATMSEEEGNFTMTQVGGDHDWHRVHTMSPNWFGETGDGAVIEYRAPEPGKVQVQWAKLGPWAMANEGEAVVTEEPSDSVPVARRVVYTMEFAVAEVQREFSGSGQTLPAGSPLRVYSTYPSILSEGRGAFPRNGSQDEYSSSLFFNASRAWIQVQVAAEDTTVHSGIQAIIRPYMFKWASEDIVGVTKPGSACLHSRWWATEEEGGQYEGGEFLRALKEEERPFGDEDDSLRRRQDLEYPYYRGSRIHGVAGCHYAAAGCFLAIGVVALVVLALRVFVGPAELTSWTGQHVYLSQTGFMPISERREYLASGYRVAPTDLGKLHLGRGSRVLIQTREGSVHATATWAIMKAPKSWCSI